MWWRLVGLVGTALLAYGCTKKEEESSPRPEPRNSAQTPGSRYTPPGTLFPLPEYPTQQTPQPVLPPRFRGAMSSSPNNITPIVPTLNCSRFRTSTPAFRVANPKRELEIISRQIIPRINRLHAEELRAGNYEALGRDTELSGMLNSLAGVSQYFREGNESDLDTESDWMNLLAVRDILTYTENTPHDLDPNSLAYQLRRAWNNGTMTLNVRGHLFDHSRVPHRSSERQDNTVGQRYRVVTFNNFSDFPDLTECHFDSRDGDVVTLVGY